MGEFDLIERYFQAPAHAMQTQSGVSLGVSLGIGDDCALLQPTPGMQLAVSSDMLLEGRHFLSTADPVKLGHKALAVNLSDLAACGAKPLAFTLALSLAKVDDTWLAGFSKGLLTLANEHNCALIGGDTTQGPLNICITVFGEVPQGQALLRSGAQVGDDIYVSGHVGDARLALEVFRGKIELPADDFKYARARMETPTPRVALGMALRGIATSAIDISDGLTGDLAHVLQASNCGAQLDCAIALNLIATQVSNTPFSKQLHTKKLLEYVLAGGDDYELLFTAPNSQRHTVLAAASTADTKITRIGQIQAETGLRLVDLNGHIVPNDVASFDHFKI